MIKHNLVKFFGGFYFEKETNNTYWYIGIINKIINDCKIKIFNKYQNIYYNFLYRVDLIKIFIRRFN